MIIQLSASETAFPYQAGGGGGIGGGVSDVGGGRCNTNASRCGNTRCSNSRCGGKSLSSSDDAPEMLAGWAAEKPALYLS